MKRNVAAGWGHGNPQIVMNTSPVNAGRAFFARQQVTLTQGLMW